MCIDVIEGKMGILTLLDEESRLPAGADQSFAGKLFQQITKPEQKEVFKKPRFNQNAFTIAHYAHDVTYDVDGFIEKNRDTVPDEHLALLQNSSNPLLKDCLEAALAAAIAAKETSAANAVASKTPAGPPKRAGGAASTKKPTLGSIFKHSLASLMDTINNTNVHYIRCIKPNEAKSAWEFESEQVLSQLRACGVLETIKISCAGYPNRWTFEEFAERCVPIRYRLECKITSLTLSPLGTRSSSRPAIGKSLKDRTIFDPFVQLSWKTASRTTRSTKSVSRRYSSGPAWCRFLIG